MQIYGKYEPEIFRLALEQKDLDIKKLEKQIEQEKIARRMLEDKLKEAEKQTKQRTR